MQDSKTKIPTKATVGRTSINLIPLLALTIFVFILLLGIEFFIISGSNRDKAYDTEDIMVDQVEAMLADNEAQIKTLTESLKENYISKAKAVAYIIDQNPDLVTDTDELNKIANLMSIDEIHIFDDTGTIYAGTVPEYYNYSFDSGEQISFFKPMLKDKDLAMCQNVVPNTAENKSMMYAICWDSAGDKMVQVGIEPDRLLRELHSSKVSDLLDNIPVTEDMTILVADAKTKIVLGSSCYSQVGKSFANLGINHEFMKTPDPEHFSSPIDGVPCFCSSHIMDDYIILISQDRKSVNRNIPVILLTVFIYLMLAAVMIGLIVIRMTRQIIAEHQNASTDMLTGLLNRRAFDDDMKRLENDPHRQDVTIVSLDLNGLKQVNDNKGHEAGDDLLCEAAACMSEQLGPLGSIYRIGGDEFAALLYLKDTPQEDVERAFADSQKNRKAKLGGDLSISSGFICAKDHPDLAMMDLFKLADDKMYQEKSNYYRQKGIDRRKRSR